MQGILRKFLRFIRLAVYRCNPKRVEVRCDTRMQHVLLAMQHRADWRETKKLLE
jgi:hypothetical protein